MQSRTGREGGKWGIHIFDAEKYLQINCHSRQRERERGRGSGSGRDSGWRVSAQKWLTNVVGPAASDVNLFQLRDFYIKHAGQFCIAAKLLLPLLLQHVAPVRVWGMAMHTVRMSNLLPGVTIFRFTDCPFVFFD